MTFIKKTTLTTFIAIISTFLCFNTSSMLISKNNQQQGTIAKNPLNAESWGKLLQLNNADFAPYKIIEAKYGTAKKNIDVSSLLQKYADQGLFPDPDIEVMNTIKNETLTDTQKQMLEKMIKEKLVYPLTDKQLEKIQHNLQAMNLFFENDPDKGKDKILAIITEIGTYKFWTRSFPPKPVGEKENRRIYIIIPEKKKNRGNYAFPIKDVITEPAPANQILEIPTPVDQPLVEPTSVDQSLETPTPVDQSLVAVNTDLLNIAQFNTKEEIEAEIKRMQEFSSTARMTEEDSRAFNEKIKALQDKLSTLQSPAQEKSHDTDGKKPIKLDLSITSLKLKKFKDLIRDNDQQPFLINNAWYGISDRNNNLDVTTQMQKYANNGLFAVPDNMNKFFGKDPFKAIEKSLFVDFTMQNKRYTISIPEHEKNRKDLAIPTKAKGRTWIATKKDDAIEKTDGKPLTISIIKQIIEATASQDISPIPEPDGSIAIGTVVEKSTFPQNGTITLQDLNLILPANDQKAFKIVDAWYGVKDNVANITTDVITKLQTYADKGLFVIPENMNNFFGKDPVPNAKKTLYIKFNMQEHIYDIMIQEHKEDRGNYDLPKKQKDKKWFVRHQGPAKFNLAQLNKLSYADRLANSFKMLTFINNHKNNTKITFLVSIFIQELDSLLQNQLQATDAEKEKLVTLLKNSRVVFTNTDKNTFEQGLQKIKSLATKYNISFSISDSFDALKTIIAWDDKDDAKEFLEILQLLANLNKEEKMSFEETVQLMAIIGSAQITPENNRDRFQEEQETLKTIYKNLTVPHKQELTSVAVVTTPTTLETTTSGEAPIPTKVTTEIKLETKEDVTVEKKPEVKPDPTLILTPAPDGSKPNPITYQTRLQKLISIDALVSDADKDACLALIEELVKDRASADNDQMNILDGIIKYYINISPFFKNDSPRITKLESASTELNSGIAYADRLTAAKRYINADSLAIDEQQELIGILRALAQEKGKADINQVSNARAYLIMTQKRLTDENSKNLLSSIELLFNAPEKPIVQPEQQAVIATQSPIIPVTLTESKAINIEKADNTSSTAISTATVIAATGNNIQTAPEKQKVLRFADRIMNSFTQILATKMNQTDDALASSFDLLQKLIDDRYLGTADDIKTLETLIIYAGSNIDNQGFKDKVKGLAGILGVTLDFQTQLKRCNDLMSSQDFITNSSVQQDTLALLQRLVGTIPADASFDLMSNLKASLIVATRIFTDAKDKALLQSLQEKVAIPTVTSKPLTEETVKSTVSQAESINMRISKLTSIENFFSTEQRIAFLTQLQSIMQDRPRATQDRLIPVLAMIESAITNPVFKDSLTKLTEYQAMLKRPATITEQVAELEEMGSFSTFLDFQNIEVLRVLQDLANQMGSMTADSLTRIKAVIMLLNPKIADDFKDAFNGLKAIFDAPASIVAPTAVTEVGEKISTTVTTANTTTPVISTTNETPAVTPETIKPVLVNATEAQSSAATAAIASTIAAATITASVATITASQAINAQHARNNATLRTLKLRLRRAAPGSESAKNLANEIATLEQENSKLQTELQKSEPDKSVIAPHAKTSKSARSIGRRTVPSNTNAQARGIISARTTQLKAGPRTASQRRPTASPTESPAAPAITPAAKTNTVTKAPSRTPARRPMRPSSRPTGALPRTAAIMPAPNASTPNVTTTIAVPAATPENTNAQRSKPIDATITPAPQTTKVSALAPAAKTKRQDLINALRSRLRKAASNP